MGTVLKSIESVTGHQNQFNIYHAPPPPTITLNGLPATAEAINHHTFAIMDAQERELKAKDDLIALLKEQVAYWKKKYSKLKAAL
jgi:hypothetical protein